MLFCSTLGPDVDYVIDVDISPRETVGRLRTLVQRKLSTKVNVDRLVIWKVSKPNHH
jgi:hypothetical protein